MYIYFNKLGKATTILPHGQVARQGGDLDLFIAMDVDFDPTNKLVEFYYKRPGDKYFSPSGTQLLLLNDGNKLEFKKNEDETYTYDLKDGEKYYTYYKHFDSNNPITAVAGTVEIVIRIYKSSPNENSNVYSVNTLDVQGLLKIYVEKTLGYSIETEFFTNPQAQTIPLDMWKNLQDSFADLHENIRCLTEEEVENLWNEVKEEGNENPTMNGVKPIAENIKYNNSLSGLAANNVQQAIDELKELNDRFGDWNVSQGMGKSTLSCGEDSMLSNKHDEFGYGTIVGNEDHPVILVGSNNRPQYTSGSAIEDIALMNDVRKKDKNFIEIHNDIIPIKVLAPKVDLLLTMNRYKNSKGIRMRGKDIWGSKYGNSLSVATINEGEYTYENVLYAIFGFNFSKFNTADDYDINIVKRAFPQLWEVDSKFPQIYFFDWIIEESFNSMNSYKSTVNDYDPYKLLIYGWTSPSCDFYENEGIYKRKVVGNKHSGSYYPDNEYLNWVFHSPTKFMIKFVKDYKEVITNAVPGTIKWEGIMCDYWFEVQISCSYYNDYQNPKVRYYARFIPHKF